MSAGAETGGTRVRLGSGHELFVHDAGSGHPVLLLHGVGCGSDDWIGSAEHFRGQFRVIRVDMRGHGRSSSPAGDWRLADFTEDLVAILDHLGIARTHVAGFSMGGLLAQALALEHPDHVDKLAIIAATSGRSAEQQAQVEERLAFIRANPPGVYFDTYAAQRWFTASFRESHPEVIEASRRTVSSADPKGYSKAYGVLVRNDLGLRLKQIRHKTLVLTGERDLGAGPNTAHFIAEQIKGSHLIILPRLRHHILLEVPEVVGGILREFFSDAD